MKKFILLLCLSVLSITGINSQNWSATISPKEGLPGNAETYYGEAYYRFNSKTYTPGGTLDIIRLTVVETISNEKPNGNNATFALSGLTVYDGNGNEVSYIAYSNADHNTWSSDDDGDGLSALSDNDIKSYFHSLWASPGVAEYHYITLSLQRSVSSFSIEWTTRLGKEKNAPTVVGITLGTDFTYTPADNSAEVAVGDAITGSNQLAVDNRFFLLKGNAQQYFTSNGTTYMGSGPIFYKSAEAGDTKATLEHIVQFIPYEDDRYLVYWPASGKFLKDSYGDYNGANGWQYSTYDINEAAPIRITATNDGFFEMQYESTYNNSPITLYIGAELRDGTVSKMKTFDLEHKQYLEAGDYTQGFSLPIAFNWSIYKTDVDDSQVDECTMQQIAELLLGGTINKATGYQGSFDAYCQNNENIVLYNMIDAAQTVCNSAGITFNDIYDAKENLLTALSAYVATKLEYYSTQVSTLLEESEFSTYPDYIKDTYPESSRSILEGLNTNIAKALVQTLSLENYEALYSQIERDIELFESTRITESITPDNKDEEEEDTTDEEILFVYLSNGDVEAFASSVIDGEHYTQNGKLYIPLKEGELVYYNQEEYDSCSLIAPELPTMQTFKFNNKYNPNLHVDAIAEPVTNEMNFRLNAIGKWLTASFTLSDDKAVAYVDTVLQVSKETRQCFKDKVTYHVTYPGYNITRRIKVQDEIWSEPVTGTQVTDVALTADMLYTNKPSTQSNESLANLLDGNPSTIFHSTWGSANNATVNVNTYITIDMPEALDKIQVYYKCRPTTGYNPLMWEIYVSNNGTSWTLVKTLDYISNSMPRGGSGQEYTSPTIEFGGSYSKIKILQTMGEYSKNHMALAELRIKKITETTGGDPVKIQDAKYEIKRIPYGNDYDVNIDWLTDTPNSVPRIDIDVDGGYDITSKDYYRKAKFRITGYGIYDNFEDSVQIKGRGNSSWSASKKPYRLKFAEKVKPFGLTKGKSWVLLANAQTGSLMANAISMKIGQLAGAEYTNHIVPVELYINGTYRGNYMFTEKVGLANNSVDVDEDTGYLLELDSNSDDEYQFKSTKYNLPVFVKEPDLNDSSTPNVIARKRNIPEQFNNLCNKLYQGLNIDDLVDMDALARFMLANDLSLNQELGHPKSIFLFKEDENSSKSKYKFGPIWDFDWGYGYENGNVYCYYGTTSSIFNIKMSTEPGYHFFSDLLNVESFRKHYYKVWNEFTANNSMEELLEYIDSYYTFAKSSFDNNKKAPNCAHGFTESDRERHKEWVQERADYIYNNLEKFDIDDLIYTVIGDVNCNNQVTIHDVALITAYINGNIHPSLSEAKADCDKSGAIDIEDARQAATIVEESDAPSAMYWYSTIQALGEFLSNDLILELDDVQMASINLNAGDEEKYKAIQFDIALPQGVELIDMMCNKDMEERNFSFTEKGNNVYRIVAYSDYDECMPENNESMVELILTASEIINEENCRIKISNAYIVDNDNNELRVADHDIIFSQATNITGMDIDALIEGGECISITLLEPQAIAIYGVDGRKIRDIRAKKGTTRIAVPAGIYIVNGEKVVVK